MAQWDENGIAPDGTYPSQLSGEHAKVYARWQLREMEANKVALATITQRLRDQKEGWSLSNQALREFIRDFEILLKSINYSEFKSVLDRAQRLPPPEQVYASVFISYGGPDESFAAVLNESLRKNAIPTFFFPEDAEPGARLHRVMRQVSDYDKVLMVISERSIKRAGVLNELENTLAREAKDGGLSYLVPIVLDNFVKEKWEPVQKDHKEAILERVHSDFSKSVEFRDGEVAVTNQAEFDKQFKRLLKMLGRGH